MEKRGIDQRSTSSPSSSSSSPSSGSAPITPTKSRESAGPPRKLSQTLYTEDESSFISYLIEEEQRSPGSLDLLYADSWCCAAVYRGLRPLGQSLVGRLVMITGNIPQATLRGWTRAEQNSHAGKVYVAAERELLELKVLAKKPYMRGAQKCWQVKMHEGFKEGLRASFCRSEDTPWKRGKITKHSPSMHVLREYHRECWEAILNHLLKNPIREGTRPASEAALKLLRLQGLISDISHDAHITTKGFHFLLQGPYSQTWVLLRSYLRFLKDKEEEARRGEEQVAERISWLTAISFIAKLSFLKPGDGYLEKNLTMHQRSVLGDFKGFGLIYQYSLKSPRYYPTPLVVSLFAPPPARASHSSGNIIVETNFRVYAYTSSPIQIATMLLFMQPFLKLPNLVVGVLTRESILDACSKGISAEQVLTYLRANSHPTALAKIIDGVPETVVEQLDLWANERTRVRFERQVLVLRTDSDADFETAHRHATEHRTLHYSDQKRRLLVVSQSCAECLRTRIVIRD